MDRGARPNLLTTADRLTTSDAQASFLGKAALIEAWHAFGDRVLDQFTGDWKHRNLLRGGQWKAARTPGPAPLGVC